MGNYIWNKLNEKRKKEYIDYLKIFGALSGLFKDHKSGNNAHKPYLHYRNHEKIFIKAFEVEDLTRKDSAFDAVGVVDGERVGIGLKTWIHSGNVTYQKVAEFNKLAPEVITPLIEQGDSEAVIRKVAELRNERIMLDKRLYNTDREVYHFVTRDDDKMNIVETSYDLIDIDSLELLSDGKTYYFKDKKNKYKFYVSKSVLWEEFDASECEIIENVYIEQFDDPFEIIKGLQLPSKKDVAETYYPEIILPLYQEGKHGPIVKNSSGLNMRHAKSKSKNSNIPRPEYEVEIRINKWIHHVFPKFFGIDALDSNQIKNKDLNDFDLILPDGRILRGRIKQDKGKSLQTSPQSELGEWILKDVLGLQNRSDIVTIEYLQILGIDSLRITKINDRQFKITVAETGAYEKFKLDNKEKMIEMGLGGRLIPTFRPELVEQLNTL